MKQKIFTTVAALIALLSVGSASAWGGFGHRCIAYVAEQHLTPEAKEKCYYYLQHTLPYYASWMDYWRGVGVYRSVNNPHSMKASADGRTLLALGYTEQGHVSIVIDLDGEAMPEI